MTDLMGYKSLTTNALREVVRAAILRAASEGLPGAHHFYIGFRTDTPDVQLAESLKARYPTEMTIVLQHQFDELNVDEDGFSVSLRFGGVPQYLYVPFSSITAFYDPSVEFGLRFDEDSEDTQDDVRAMGESAPLNNRSSMYQEDNNDSEDTQCDVVSLDAFRKK